MTDDQKAALARTLLLGEPVCHLYPSPSEHWEPGVPCLLCGLSFDVMRRELSSVSVFDTEDAKGSGWRRVETYCDGSRRSPLP